MRFPPIALSLALVLGAFVFSASPAAAEPCVSKICAPDIVCGPPGCVPPVCGLRCVPCGDLSCVSVCSDCVPPVCGLECCMDCVPTLPCANVRDCVDEVPCTPLSDCVIICSDCIPTPPPGPCPDLECVVVCLDCAALSPIDCYTIVSTTGNGIRCYFANRDVGVVFCEYCVNPDFAVRCHIENARPYATCTVTGPDGTWG